MQDEPIHQVLLPVEMLAWPCLFWGSKTMGFLLWLRKPPFVCIITIGSVPSNANYCLPERTDVVNKSWRLCGRSWDDVVDNSCTEGNGYQRISPDQQLSRIQNDLQYITKINSTWNPTILRTTNIIFHQTKLVCALMLSFRLNVSAKTSCGRGYVPLA